MNNIEMFLFGTNIVTILGMAYVHGVMTKRTTILMQSLNSVQQIQLASILDTLEVKNSPTELMKELERLHSTDIHALIHPEHTH